MTTPQNLGVSTTAIAVTTNPPAAAPLAPRRPMTIHEILINRYPEYATAHNLGLYGYPVLTVLATIGNLLTLLIMLKPSMRTKSTCFYMASLAIFDTMAIYFNCFTKWITLFEDIDALKVSDAACKTINFMSYTSFDIAVWILVAMTIERFVAVHFPFKASKYATIKHAKIVLVSIIVVFTGINLHFFWTVSLNSRGQCASLEDHEDFHNEVWPWIDATMYSFLPFVLLLVFNILIIYDNRKHFLRRSTLHARRAKAKNHNSRFHFRLSAMLVTVSIVFLVLSSPNVILILIRNKYFDFSQGVKDLRDIAVFSLWSRTTSFCLYLNHSINLVLYCLSGQRFRRELINLLMCKWNVQQIRTSSYLETTRTQRLSETSGSPTSVGRPSSVGSPTSVRTEMENYM